MLAAALVAGPVLARGDPAADVSQVRLRSDVSALVKLGTRHTLSAQGDPKRGIGAAWRWGEAQFRAAGEACGGCLEIVTPETTAAGSRIPAPVHLIDVVAVQRGTERPNEVVIVQGHIDSRVSDVMNATSDAPGANDDGSGTALVVVTRGAAGATGYCAQGRVEIPAPKVSVVDTVGAGDSFQSALLSQLPDHQSLRATTRSLGDLGRVLDFAARAAAICLS